MTNLLIVSYNILTENYCNAESYTPEYYSKLAIDPEHRMLKIVKKLEEFVNKNAIIALQEVSVKRSCELSLFFQKHKYNFYYHSYGSESSGYMGVGIAVPMALNVLSVDKFRLANGKEWPNIDTRPNLLTKILKTVSLGYIDITPNQHYAWKNSRSKYNFAVTVEVECGDKSVFVSTVHLPCAYNYPSTMITYASLAMARVQQLAQKSPYVLCGDFNILPHSNEYKLITTGSCDEMSICADFPKCDTYRPTYQGLAPMQSALKLLNGTEPKFTCNSAANFNGKLNIFKNTLDYIFISEGVVPIEGVALVDENIFYPNDNEPSDHLLIWVMLKV